MASTTNGKPTAKGAPDPGGGAEVLRAALAARARKHPLGPYARDVEVALPALEAFATGGAKLAPEVLERLAERLFVHTRYDRDSDLLVPIRETATLPLGRPAPIDFAKLSTWRGPAGPIAPRPASEAPKPRPRRPGWGWPAW
jgi:hypothetical protein